jgi:hypothetical protein
MVFMLMMIVVCVVNTSQELEVKAGQKKCHIIS